MRVKPLLVMLASLALARPGWAQYAGPAGGPPPFGPPPASPGADMMGPGLLNGVFPPGPPGPPLPPPNAPYPIPESWLHSKWNPAPSIEASAEAIWLQPDFAESAFLFNQFVVNENFLFQGQPTPIEVKTEFNTAVRFALEYHKNECRSYEATGFFMNGPDQFNVPMAANDLTYFLTNARGGGGFLTHVPPGFPDEADDARVDWQFETGGFDLSVLHHWVLMQGAFSDLALGVGFRYFRLNETVNLRATDELRGVTGTLGAVANNALAGFQITARNRLQTPIKCFRVVSELKIGLMANSMEDQTFVGFGGEPAPVATGRFTEVFFAPLFEGNFLFEFFVTSHVTLFSGIQLLYVDQVDRAGDSFVPNLETFVTTYTGQSSLFLFGPRVGLLVSY